MFPINGCTWFQVEEQEGDCTTGQTQGDDSTRNIFHKEMTQQHQKEILKIIKRKKQKYASCKLYASSNKNTYHWLILTIIIIRVKH